jgi:serine/threonine protein phosphatase 1
MIYAIGDIHGEIGHLDRLLGRILEDACASGVGRPRVITLGDIGDRGSDTRAVYDRLSSGQFSEAFDATLILGNHERMLIDTEHDLSSAMPWLENGGAELVESYGFDFRRSPSLVLPEFYTAFPAAHRALLARMRLWHQEDGYLFVHAGINPLRPQDRDPAHLLWIREPFLSSAIDYGFVVVHGHTPSSSVAVRFNRIGVDTGCGHGNDAVLSAVVLEAGGPPLRVLDSR